MTKGEFLNALREATGHLPPAEAEKAISYYSEIIEDLIEDGLTAEQAVLSLGSMEKIVNAVEEEVPLGQVVSDRIRRSKKESKSSLIWIILAICGAPVWLPVLTSVLMVVLTFYFTVWILIFALFAVVFSLAIAGLAGIAGGVFQIVISNAPAGIFIIGGALVCAGLAILLISPVTYLAKSVVRLTLALARKIKRAFLSGRRQTETRGESK